ncbi:MAG: hypothetical protein M3447_11330 [Acidobacteriota bacterium]|nr:hypothetical protein [Acidobacteriota bacterium]
MRLQAHSHEPRDQTLQPQTGNYTGFEKRRASAHPFLLQANKNRAGAISNPSHACTNLDAKFNLLDAEEQESGARIQKSGEKKIRRKTVSAFYSDC